MKIKTAIGNIAEVESGAIIVNFFEGLENLYGEIEVIDKALDGAITQLIKQGEIKGKVGEITVIHSLGKLPAARVVVAGLGKKDELSKDKVRRVVAETCRLLRKKGVDNLASIAQGAEIAGISVESAAQAIAEGILLGTYSFRKHVTKEAEYGEIKKVVIVDADTNNLTALEQGCYRGRIMAEAANLARDMVNEPANFMTPTNMAEMAAKLAETHPLEINVLEREQMQELGMGALLGVSRGSEQPPKLIVLCY